jgi:Holliday junction DNA helicase RuvA
MSPEGPRSTPQRVHVSDGACLDDVLSALINLGYKENQARKVLESLEIPPGTHLEDVLKGALKILMK